MVFVGPVGISGYVPGVTLIEILVVVGGAAAATVFASWLVRYRKQRTAKSQP